MICDVFHGTDIDLLTLLLYFLLFLFQIGGYAWDLTDHSFSYAQYGVTGAAAGAWWCGLAGIVAGIIGVVAIDKDWFIATCALSSAACAISIAGAVVDGIYATWHLSIRSCVNWNGDGGISTATTSTSTTWWFPPISGTSGSISQGWQYSGQALYATDALYCYTSLSGNANRVVQLTGTQTITSAALQLISGYISLARTGTAEDYYTPRRLFSFSHSSSSYLIIFVYSFYAGVSTSGSVFPTMSSVTTALTAGTNVLAGPLYWLFVGSINGLQSNDDPNFTPPTNKQCFCKSFDSRTLVSGFQPGTVATGNVVSTYPRAPTTGTTVLNTVTLANSFNAYDNCWQINAGARYGCNNVFADGYNYFATSCAFCVFVAALTATMAIFSGMAFSWHPPRQTDPEQPVGIAGGSVNY